MVFFMRDRNKLSGTRAMFKAANYHDLQDYSLTRRQLQRLRKIFPGVEIQRLIARPRDSMQDYDIQYLDGEYIFRRSEW